MKAKFLEGLIKGIAGGIVSGLIGLAVLATGWAIQFEYELFTGSWAPSLLAAKPAYLVVAPGATVAVLVCNVLILLALLPSQKR